MGPEGWFGQAMRRKLVATVQGSGVCRTLFVHAGLLPRMLEVCFRMSVLLYPNDDELGCSPMRSIASDPRFKAAVSENLMNYFS